MTKPATPLPWDWMSNDKEGGAGIVVLRSDGQIEEVAADATRADAAYIVHACNAYPRLVAALREVRLIAEAVDRSYCNTPREYRNKTLADAVEIANSLLRELEQA